MYDFAHPLEDAFEGITHSICTLEFEDHRPLYDWVKINCGFEPGPRQIEFARLNMNRTIMSKRYLKKLVDEGFVEGWSVVIFLNFSIRIVFHLVNFVASTFNYHLDWIFNHHCSVCICVQIFSYA